MPAPLQVEVFTAPAKALNIRRPRPFGPEPAWDPMTSTLILGEHQAVLVDVPATVREAEQVADWIESQGRSPETIYITHGHIDHFATIGWFRRRFPGVRAVATPGTIELMHQQLSLLPFYRQLFADALPEDIELAEPIVTGAFTLEGHELRVIEQGRTDCADTTSLYVPAIDLVVAGDVVYNQCHMYLAESTATSRQQWLAALDRLAVLKPKIVVAGHKKPGVPDTAEAIDGSRHYLQDFEELATQQLDEHQIYDQMIRRYPEWDSPQAWLMFGFGTRDAVTLMRDQKAPRAMAQLLAAQTKWYLRAASERFVRPGRRVLLRRRL